MSGFALEAVTCVRAGRVLFETLSLRLAPGDAALVSGPNGVGKSSLIRIAAGLLRPAAGRVMRGEDLRVALLTEAAALDADRTVESALIFWAKLDRVPDPRAAVTSALADLDLAHLAQVPVRILSTGQRRRVAMARVIASGAPLWLLDEPANGLDAAAITRLESLLARHRERGGMTIVATHLPISLPNAVLISLQPTPPFASSEVEKPSPENAATTVRPEPVEGPSFSSPAEATVLRQAQHKREGDA